MKKTNARAKIGLWSNRFREAAYHNELADLKG